jgi:hypothetical protein
MARFLRVLMAVVWSVIRVLPLGVEIRRAMQP